MDVPQKYGLVRAIAALLKVLAVIILILGIVALVGSLLMGNQYQLPLWMTLGSAVALPLVALLTSAQLYAFGAILSLLVKIEKNTRSMS
jgi:uncharacterized protein (DUF983 family)